MNFGSNEFRLPGEISSSFFFFAVFPLAGLNSRMRISRRQFSMGRTLNVFALGAEKNRGPINSFRSLRAGRAKKCLIRSDTFGQKNLCSPHSPAYTSFVVGPWRLDQSAASLAVTSQILGSDVGQSEKVPEKRCSSERKAVKRFSVVIPASRHQDCLHFS